MKFYKSKKDIYSLIFIKTNKLTAIYVDYFAVDFFKDGLRHNIKNATCIGLDGYKSFYLNNKCYGDEDDFTKESWRKFVKLKVFL